MSQLELPEDAEPAPQEACFFHIALFLFLYSITASHAAGDIRADWTAWLYRWPRLTNPNFRIHPSMWELVGLQIRSCVSQGCLFGVPFHVQAVHEKSVRKGRLGPQIPRAAQQDSESRGQLKIFSWVDL